MGMKGKLQNQEKHEQDISREDGARLSFPEETSEPSIRKQSYEEQTNGNEIEIWRWSHTSFNKRDTVFSSYQSNLRARVGAESVHGRCGSNNRRLQRQHR